MKFLFVFLFSAKAFASGEIVTSFSILGDWAKQIAPSSAQVLVLAGPDVDTHTFEPRPSDIKKLKDAKLVARMGLGFEPWFERAFKSAQSKARLATVTEGITPLKTEDRAADPHVWQDPDLAIKAVETLSQAIKAEFPKDAAEIERKTADYKARLEKIRDEIKAGFQVIPREKRIAVTSHDAFEYFAKAFDLTLISPQGWSTEVEPSAKKVAKIIKQIRDQKAHALFVEKLASPKVMKQIADETNAKIGGELYADALSNASGPAPTYEALLKWNAETFQKALR